MADTKNQDAVALLKQDHRTVEELFEQFEQASGDGRKQRDGREDAADHRKPALDKRELLGDHGHGSSS